MFRESERSHIGDENRRSGGFSWHLYIGAAAGLGTALSVRGWLALQMLIWRDRQQRSVARRLSSSTTAGPSPLFPDHAPSPLPRPRRPLAIGLWRPMGCGH